MDDKQVWEIIVNSDWYACVKKEMEEKISYLKNKLASETQYEEILRYQGQINGFEYALWLMRED